MINFKALKSFRSNDRGLVLSGGSVSNGFQSKGSLLSPKNRTANLISPKNNIAPPKGGLFKEKVMSPKAPANILDVVKPQPLSTDAGNIQSPANVNFGITSPPAVAPKTSSPGQGSGIV